MTPARATRLRPRRSGLVVPQPVTWRGRLAAAAVYGLIRALAATVHFRWQGHAEFLDGQMRESVIFSIWHNRLALALVIYRLHARRQRQERRLAALVSASRDGGLLARVLEHFGVQPVRGSSSRRGPQALLELTTWAERGYDLALTPDGPRGPCYAVQEGVIALAQLTGQPILPVAYHLNRKVRLRSWDRFQVPLPFATCTVSIGQPLRVPRELRDEEREAWRQRLEQVMRAITAD